MWNPFQSIVALVKSNLRLEMGTALGVCPDFSPCRDLGCFSSFCLNPQRRENLSQGFRLRAGVLGSSWVMALLYQKMVACRGDTAASLSLSVLHRESAVHSTPSPLPASSFLTKKKKKTKNCMRNPKKGPTYVSAS